MRRQDIFSLHEEKMIESVKCPICMQINICVYNIKCGHTLCLKCITDLPKDIKNMAKCPICVKTFNPTIDIKKNFALNEVIGNLTVVCHYLLCDWKGNFSGLESHLKTCDYEKDVCDLCRNAMVMRREMVLHKKECPLRDEPCEYCSKIMKVAEIIEHHGDCPKFIIDCECKKPLTRDVWQIHCQNECPETILRCPLYYMGCKESPKRKDIKEHIDKNLASHMILMVVALNEKNEFIGDKEIFQQVMQGQEAALETFGYKIVKKGSEEHKQISKYISEKDRKEKLEQSIASNKYKFMPPEYPYKKF